MNQTLIALLGTLGGVVVALVDGPRAVRVGAVAAGLVLAPAAASVGGYPAALVPLLAGIIAAVLATAAERLALRLRAVPGLDPLVPVVAPRHGLFGPRSIRTLGAALGVVGASWVSLNVEVGGVATARGAVFATGYLWLMGSLRLLRGRALEDLATGAAAVALAAATGWLLEAGPGALPEAAAAAGLAPAAAVTAGWLVGRHHRRATTAPAEDSTPPPTAAALPDAPAEAAPPPGAAATAPRPP